MKQTILLVDDQPALRALVALELQRMGYNVVTAADGPETMQQLEEIPLSLVILDLLLPEVDGLELLELIKQKQPEMPVIILTGAGYNDDAMAEALARGADGYVSKGLSISHLVMEIHRVLGPGRQKEMV